MKNQSPLINHGKNENPKVRENWRAAIDKESEEMNKKKVREVIKKEDNPKN
jgi:hypothetical protein